MPCRGILAFYWLWAETLRYIGFAVMVKPVQVLTDYKHRLERHKWGCCHNYNTYVIWLALSLAASHLEGGRPGWRGGRSISGWDWSGGWLQRTIWKLIRRCAAVRAGQWFGQTDAVAQHPPLSAPTRGTALLCHPRARLHRRCFICAFRFCSWLEIFLFTQIHRIAWKRCSEHEGRQPPVCCFKANTTE